MLQVQLVDRLFSSLTYPITSVRAQTLIIGQHDGAKCKKMNVVSGGIRRTEDRMIPKLCAQVIIL